MACKQRTRDGCIRQHSEQDEGDNMKKWTLMVGIVIGALVVAVAAFAAAPLSALAQGETAPVVASRLVDRLQGVFSADNHGGRGGGAEGLVSATASVTGL